MRENWHMKQKRYFSRGLFLVFVSLAMLAGLTARTLLSFQVVRGFVVSPPSQPPPGAGSPVSVPPQLLPDHEILSFLLGLFPPMDLHTFNRGDQVGLVAVFLLLLGVLFLERSKNYRYRILNARRTEEEKNQ